MRFRCKSVFNETKPILVIMVVCASVKSRGSKERCPHNALRGVTLCGRHVRSKNVVLWSVANGIDDKVIKISKVWRGYLIRKLLKLAGKGVLKRSVCNNADEIISMESISSIYPLDYFSFEENDKIYGFDIRTIIDIMNKQGNPSNPYTRQPLSIQVRKRFRELFAYRLRNHLPCFYENNKFRSPDQVIENRWLQLCQVVEENGFFDMNPMIFTTMNKSQLYIFLSMVCNDMKAQLADRKIKRANYIFWIQNVVK